MAKFEGVHWGSVQLQYLLADKTAAVLPERAKAHTVSRSIITAYSWSLKAFDSLWRMWMVGWRSGFELASESARF